MSAFNENHVTATFLKAGRCPHSTRDVEIHVELDRGVVALTTTLSGFYEMPRPFDIETCIDEGLEEITKRTNIRLEARHDA